MVLPAEAKLVLAGKPVELNHSPRRLNYWEDYLYAGDWAGGCVGVEPLHSASHVEPWYYGYHGNGRLGS